MSLAHALVLALAQDREGTAAARPRHPPGAVGEAGAAARAAPGDAQQALRARRQGTAAIEGLFHAIDTEGDAVVAADRRPGRREGL